MNKQHYVCMHTYNTYVLMQTRHATCGHGNAYMTQISAKFDADWLVHAVLATNIWSGR